MTSQGADIGIVGLGVMGQNLVLNIADHGFSVVGYNRDENKTGELLSKATGGQPIRGAFNLQELTGLLKRPRCIILLVPAGPSVDSVIEGLLPHLDPSDLIIDSGNSHFKHTDRRIKLLSKRGLLFLGMGISGGEHGARYGPSMMPGGPRDGYDRVKLILEKIAARVDGDPCVAHLGRGSAGHYVKMVHNGIEYGLMQLIAETYDLMKRGLGLNNDALHRIYNRWRQTELGSYLLEITSNIFLRDDEKTGERLVDLILDEAGQKGTGEWTSQNALDLQVPTPTIDVAVMMRNLSGYKTERKMANERVQGTGYAYQGDKAQLVDQMKNALYTAMLITFSQGMALLYRASNAYDYHLDLEAVARIWRGGCIIRAVLLEDIRTVFKTDPGLPNLLLGSHMERLVQDRQADLRNVIRAAVDLGLPVPGLMASLAYLDAYRSEWLPANLIQAQRDYFGAHTYKRTDEEGNFHTQWVGE
jgi:6-phosphogluconate dehydrogenase